ncbi:MAG: SGNH/GDSL hydrolase family protein [Vicinamibacterales bacterium]
MSSDVPVPDTGSLHSLRGAVGLLFVLSLASIAGAVAMRLPDVVLASMVLGGACLARLTSPPAPATRSRAVALAAGAAVNAVLLVATLVGSIAAAEYGTRWLFRDVTTTADFRGYFTTKWMRTQVRHNHYDYRGGEFEEVKPAGVYRVAVMGDSFTYGNGVREDQRFSNLVGAALADRHVEVLNFGFPGNNWPEHVRTLERRVLRLRPDFVLLQWGTNDIELDEHVAGRPKTPPLIADRDWHEWLYARSALYTMINAQWVRWQIRKTMGDSYDHYLVRLYGDPASEGARRAETLMRRFLELCRERGVGVGLVLFPDAAVSLGPDYPYQFMHDRVAAICREAAITCLDLLPEYRKVPDRFSLWVTPLDAHPSALANRMAADAVLAAFAPGWHAPSPSR